MDDDQLQLRSILLALLGISRKHNFKAKRYGPVQDILASFGTGAVFAGNFVAGGQSGTDSFAVCMKLISARYGGLCNNIAPGSSWPIAATPPATVRNQD